MLNENDKIFEAYQQVMVNEMYTDKIKGVPKKAMDLFKNLQTNFDTKEMGFKKLNVGKSWNYYFCFG
jgi:alpha-ketoglutarate-dependent taurine dioxygenase